MNEEIAEEEEADEIDEAIEENDDDEERYIEYDSDENEVFCLQCVFKLLLLTEKIFHFQIEVTMKKKDMEKKASEYFENEAELSGSDWGSADEDEQDLDKYEGDLADEEDFDRRKIRSELDRIRM